LKFYGISGKAKQLITSYLQNRYQRVLIKNKGSINYFSEWTLVKKGVPQGSVLGPLFFLLYINDLPSLFHHVSMPTLFADYTRLIYTNSNLTDFENGINTLFSSLNNWSETNLLSLNYNKTHCMQFLTKTNQDINLRINLNNTQIERTLNTKFLGLIIDNTLPWKAHIDYILPKLSTACYAIRFLKSLISPNNLRMIYFSYVHSIITYGIIFWGNSPHSKTIFKFQKKAIRIITNSGIRASCRDKFKDLKILPLPSQYIFSLMLFLVKNKELFKYNSDVHSVYTRHRTVLHPPLQHLSTSQKGVYFSGTKIFNQLPQKIRDLSHDIKKFKGILKTFLLMGSFYPLEEYFAWDSRIELGIIYNN
jgi:hypothetical protein